MIITYKPIKRSKFLAQLSREHHSSLQFAWKIRQGMTNKVSIERIVGYCQWFFENHLKMHFRKEENALSKILPATHPMMTKMIQEHEDIKMKVAGLLEYASEDGLERLAGIVSCHVRFEERQLFQLAEKKATQEQLEQLEKDLLDTPDSELKWTDEFWTIRF